MPEDLDLSHAVRMSNRQYTLLRYLSGAHGSILTAEELSHLSQTTVGANKRRGWLTETKDKDGVTLTREGRAALKNFDNADIVRMVARMQFSKYLSLDVYDKEKETEHQKRRRSLKIVHRKSA